MVETNMTSQYATEFDLIEARVLACLMEKQLTTPDQYPLTQNALMSACNQKTNRNPVMDLKAGEVGHTVMKLAQEGWIRVEQGSRTERYQQKCAFKLKLMPAEQAVICMLMLRGPQTLSELAARTERMIKGGEDALLDALDSLMNREQALVEQLERQTGQREDRYGQLLFDQGELVSKVSSTPKTVEIHHPDADRIEALEAEVAKLKQQMQGVMEQVGLSEPE